MTGEPSPERLQDTEEKILLCLARYSSPYRVPAWKVAEEIGIPAAKAEYYLEELVYSKLVSPDRFGMGQTDYQLTQDGRRYLVARDLI